MPDITIKRGTAKRLGLRQWRRIRVMVTATQCDGCRAVEPAPDGELPAGWKPSADLQGDFCPACIAAEPTPIVFPIRSGVDTPMSTDPTAVIGERVAERPTGTVRLEHLYCPRCYPHEDGPATSLCRRLTAIANDAEPGRPPCVVCVELGKRPCEVCGFSPWGSE